MAICAPSGYFEWAETSSSARFGWLFIGWFFAQQKARRVVGAAHPADIAAAKTSVCRFNPVGCTCKTKLAGPFESSSTTGFFSGSVTITQKTQVIAEFTCTTVPAGAMEYKTIQSEEE